MQPNDPEKSPLAQKEEQILKFWEENKIFKKSLEKESPEGDFVFYDGPPFATGEPHYGHVVPGTIKDIIPRYKTMRGYKVRRRWGWDCHGLPVENIIEKELNLQSKKDILDFGIDKFNEKAKGAVLRYADDWRKIIPRLGRWVDMDDDYRTMDATYTESVWWAFSELHKKGLIYEGFKSMQLCPRCETTLSNFEVSQGYKDITDISVYVKFRLTSGQKYGEKKDLLTSDNIYVIAWTTTPWTLPGNAALAINKDISYSVIKTEEGPEHFIVASNLVEKVFKDKKIEKINELKGSGLVGLKYEAVFDYYTKDSTLKNKENGWKIYGADFVTTDSGTGVVHIAPAFGSDDYELSLKEKIPFIQHVSTNGVFKPEVTDFAGQQVKPKGTKEEKDAHQKADIEIIKYLAHHGSLFAKEKLIHSYPHCWRCDTPLLNYAASSWFVKVTDLKDKLVKENSKVKWTPTEIGEKRFGDWLKNARDWAISRSRFWGAPIPVWKTEKGEVVVMESVADLKKHSIAKNTYYCVRHGEADNNTLNVMSGRVDNPHHLSPKGITQAHDAAKWLKDKKIDVIISSPFVRTRETAEIIAKDIHFDPKNIQFDDQIRELNVGVWEGKPFGDFQKAFVHKDRFDIRVEGGENYADLKKRMGDFLYSLEKKYEGKNILIVSHDSPLFLLKAAADGLSKKQAIELRGNVDHFNHNATPFALEFHPLPHNENYEVEFHRPYIDQIPLVKDGQKLMRVPEVFDCWFESGSMPYGETHYPFNKSSFNPNPGPFSKILGRTKGYPADFIAEGLDQTRGWFYSMIVLGTALFGKSPYKKVVVNGLVLAEDGQKMSKSKKNYPDLRIILDKYGADALRYFLMSSAVVKAQDVVFSEKGVDEVVKKHIGRLNNVVSFYEMYAKANDPVIDSKHPLDKWILNRLNELGSDITKCLEKYEIDKAARPFADFIDDLSTWYIRRSRDRFKGGDKADREASLSTTRTVLLELSKYLAPFMPFLAEDIYSRIKGAGDMESVHLEKWPKPGKVDRKVLNNMAAFRKIASLGLEARMKAKINVRQPLPTLTLKEKLPTTNEVLLSILKDEINVKNIVVDEKIKEEVVLDINITPELKEEGTVRELIRSIQDMRKEANLTVDDVAKLEVGEAFLNAALLKKHADSIKKTTNLSDIVFVPGDAAPHLYNSGVSHS
jgi:isoleucyl-tRNA synthetase